ncbi:hypothetical protein [Longimicrobium sp.]|uniref:hypothetical protein n=1 Tax=Longimicrobium sp. TaxID=2029185 RepID=UPI003B3AFEC8
MPVVINEIQVSTEPDTEPMPGGTPRETPPPLTPLEIAELLERRARNELRLFAH